MTFATNWKLSFRTFWLHHYEMKNDSRAIVHIRPWLCDWIIWVIASTKYSTWLKRTELWLFQTITVVWGVQNCYRFMEFVFIYCVILFQTARLPSTGVYILEVFQMWINWIKLNGVWQPELQFSSTKSMFSVNTASLRCFSKVESNKT